MREELKIIENKNKSNLWEKPEFCLVIAMLFVLFLLVIVVLIVPVQLGDSTTTAKDILDYRQNILAVILTAFGAWVGAGAAYFFGRESQRQANEGMLKMREPSAKERLHQTRIRNIPPEEIKWYVTYNEKVKNVINKLKQEPDRWFIPIVKNDGTLGTVIHEEAIWRFIVEKNNKEGTLSDVLKYLDEVPKLKNWAEDIYVKANLDNSAGYVDEMIKEKKDVYLAIITDEKGKPTHFITTGTLRKILMQSN